MLFCLSFPITKLIHLVTQVQYESPEKKQKTNHQEGTNISTETEEGSPEDSDLEEYKDLEEEVQVDNKIDQQINDLTEYFQGTNIIQESGNKMKGQS